jgi:hypothetical protein
VLLPLTPDGGELSAIYLSRFIPRKNCWYPLVLSMQQQKIPTPNLLIYSPVIYTCSFHVINTFTANTDMFVLFFYFLTIYKLCTISILLIYLDLPCPTRFGVFDHTIIRSIYLFITSMVVVGILLENINNDARSGKYQNYVCIVVLKTFKSFFC